MRLAKISPSTWIALLALAIALGGSAYAFSLPRDSVGTKHLKDGAVTSPKVQNGTLRPGDIATNVFASRDVTSYPAGTITLTNSYATMIDLAGVNTGSVNQKIKTGAHARILAVGTADIYATSGAGAQGICKLTITEPSGTKMFSQEHEFDFPTSSGHDITVSVPGGIVEPPGTYNVALECAGNGTSLNSADLIVWAAPL